MWLFWGLMNIDVRGLWLVWNLIILWSLKQCIWLLSWLMRDYLNSALFLLLELFIMLCSIDLCNCVYLLLRYLLWILWSILIIIINIKPDIAFNNLKRLIYNLISLCLFTLNWMLLIRWSKVCLLILWGNWWFYTTLDTLDWFSFMTWGANASRSTWPMLRLITIISLIKLLRMMPTSTSYLVHLINARNMRIFMRYHVRLWVVKMVGMLLLARHPSTHYSGISWLGLTHILYLLMSNLGRLLLNLEKRLCSRIMN